MKKFSKIQKIISSKKIKFNGFIILIFLLLSISFALADTEPTSFGIKIYDDTIEITSDKYTLLSKDLCPDKKCSKPFNITAILANGSEIGIDKLFFTLLNGSEVGVERLAVKENTFDFYLVFTAPNDTAKNIDFAEDYYICVADKASYNTAWTACVLDLDEYEGENATTNKEELDSCNLRIQEKDIEIGGKDNTIKDLEDEKKDTENLKWIYAIIATIIGVVGCLIYCGKIGKGAVKDKSMDEFSKRQSS